MLHKILKNRKIWAAALLMVLLALGVAQAAGVQPQKSSLSGQVATVVSVGTQVSEGSVLDGEDIDRNGTGSPRQLQRKSGFRGSGSRQPDRCGSGRGYHPALRGGSRLLKNDRDQRM